MLGVHVCIHVCSACVIALGQFALATGSQLAAFWQIEGYQGLGKQITHSLPNCGGSHIPAKTFNSPCVQKTQCFTPIKTIKILIYIYVYSICSVYTSVLEFKHSIISVLHVESNAHWNLLQDLHHWTRALTFCICLGQLARPPAPNPPVLNSSQCGPCHSHCVPQPPSDTLELINYQNKGNRGGGNIPFLLHVIQLQRYFRSNLITNEIIPTSAEHGTDLGIGVKSSLSASEGNFLLCMHFTKFRSASASADSTWILTAKEEPGMTKST